MMDFSLAHEWTDGWTVVLAGVPLGTPAGALDGQYFTAALMGAVVSAIVLVIVETVFAEFIFRPLKVRWRTKEVRLLLMLGQTRSGQPVIVGLAPRGSLVRSFITVGKDGFIFKQQRPSGTSTIFCYSKGHVRGTVRIDNLPNGNSTSLQIVLLGEKSEIIRLSPVS